MKLLLFFVLCLSYSYSISTKLHSNQKPVEDSSKVPTEAKSNLKVAESLEFKSQVDKESKNLESSEVTDKSEKTQTRTAVNLGYGSSTFSSQLNSNLKRQGLLETSSEAFLQKTNSGSEVTEKSEVSESSEVSQARTTEYIGLGTCSDSACRKDMYAGQWVNCNGNAAFARNTSINIQTCQQMCIDDPGCTFLTGYSNVVCNLFYGACGTTKKTTGAFYKIATKTPAPTPAPQKRVGQFTGNQTCSDSACRKDMYAGRWVNCNNNASFGQTYGTQQQCEAWCAAEANCTYYTVYSNNVCNMFFGDCGKMFTTTGKTYKMVAA